MWCRCLLFAQKVNYGPISGSLVVDHRVLCVPFVSVMIEIGRAMILGSVVSCKGSVSDSGIFVRLLELMGFPQEFIIIEL